MSLVAALELWEESVGLPPYRVTVYENAKRKRVLYLKWRADGNWKYLSLTAAAARDGFDTATLFTLDGDPLAGRALRERQRWALEQAKTAEAKLRLGMPVVEAKRAKPLTLGEAWALVSDKDTGKYPEDSRHRREVDRELRTACRILGEDLPWLSIRRAELTKLWRTRIRELLASSTKEKPVTGLRGAEITVARVLAVAQWLRDNEHIPGDACIVTKWKDALRTDWQAIAQADRIPEPNRPRHELEDLRKLLGCAWSVDPRFGLLLALGAELRGGQVKRARRSDVDLEANTFRVPGMGKKRGAVVHLTAGQRSAVYVALAGYLAPLESARVKGELADYYLFPRGQMPGGRSGHPVAEVARHGHAKPLGTRTLQTWMKLAEAEAGIEHVKGRALYGLRRVSVDAGKDEGISREGLKELGGWTDTQVPDRIYAEQDRKRAREEAATVRAKTRGE